MSLLQINTWCVWCRLRWCTRWGNSYGINVRRLVNKKKAQYVSHIFFLKKIYPNTWTRVKTLRQHTWEHKIIATFVFPKWNINYYDKWSRIDEEVRIVLNIYCTMKHANLFMALKRFPNNLLFRVFRSHVIFIPEYTYLVAVIRFYALNKKRILRGQIKCCFSPQRSRYFQNLIVIIDNVCFPIPNFNKDV